jgi:RNA polymerase-binding transcription factor DksA
MEQELKTIQVELAQTVEHITRLEEALEEKPDYGLGKGDPAIVRWELNQALLLQARERAANLERAVSRLEQGTYGICERCSGPIHPDRVAVLPDVRLCIRCALADEPSSIRDQPPNQLHRAADPA